MVGGVVEDMVLDVKGMVKTYVFCCSVLDIPYSVVLSGTGMQAMWWNIVFFECVCLPFCLSRAKSSSPPIDSGYYLLTLYVTK